MGGWIDDLPAMFEREMEVCASAVAGVAGQADQGASIDDASGTD
jgi:hypothetical protein